MGQVKDMTGYQCGRLTVIARGPDFIEKKSGYHRARWWCRCSCGNTSLVIGKYLRNGNTKSCGCMIRDKCSDVGKNNKGTNQYEIIGDLVIGTSMKGDRFYFDLEDFEKVSRYYWYKHHSGYFFANDENGGRIALHRLVMDAKSDERIDHINHQKENACKSNLRIVTASENSFNSALAKNNTSGRTGVHYNRREKMWVPTIMKDGESVYLGKYSSFEEAVAVRKAAEEKYFGQYSYDNSMAASPLIEVA